MIYELLQLLDILLYGKIHLLVIFFIVFVILPLYMIRRDSERYNMLCIEPSLDVTVIVPVHLEDYNAFENCVSSISVQHPKQFIVSIDSNDQKLIDIANKYGAEVLIFTTRVGKRKALADAWLKAFNDIIVHVDSDIIIGDNCLKELTKPFNNSPNIVGVASNHTCTNNGSMISYILSSSIEQSRRVNDRALNGNLVVIDGRGSAWRRDFLLSIRDEFLNEYWMNVKCEIGDDRFLSHKALKQKFKTVHCESAQVYTPAPDSFEKFLGQQIRWRRSGTKFWIKDLKEGVYPTKLYAYKCAVYYLSPFILSLVVILDILFFKLSFKFWNFWQISIILTVIGTTLITIIRQMIYFDKILFPKYIILQALLGLFILLPISIYGALTIKKQDLWITRHYASDIHYERKGT